MNYKISLNNCCTECGKNEMTADMSLTLLSNPPQYRVECSCGHKTTMTFKELILKEA